MTRFTRTSVARLSGLPGYRNILATLGRFNKEGKGNSYLEPWTTDSIIKRFQDEVDSIALGLDPVLDEMERSNRAKAQPFDRPPYPEWSDRVHDYWNQTGYSVYSEEVQSELLKNLLDYFDANQITAKLQPLTFEEGYTQSRKGTSLGLPHLTSDWSRREILAEYLGRGQKLYQGKRAFLNPFMMFVRVMQGSGKGNNKIRPVWGSDHAETFGSLPFVVPVQNYLREYDGFSAWQGIDGVSSRVASWRRPLDRDYVYLSGDISRMDQSVHEADLRLAFNAIGHLISMNPKTVESLIEYYTFGELVTPEGILGGRHGLPSGVAFTSLANTIIVTSKVVTAMTRLGYRIQEVRLEVHGDDFVVTVKKDDTVRLIDIMKELGIDVSDDPAKSMRDGERFQYLQRLWTPHLDAVYPLQRVVARLVHSDRFVTNVVTREGEKTEFDKGIRMLQVYSKLENAKNHPRFLDFVALVGKYDRYQLSPEIIGGKWKFLEGVQGYVSRPSELGQGGLENTSTFKAVMKLREVGKLRPQTGD